MSERDALTRNLRDELMATADFKQAELSNWLNERQADVKMLAINKNNYDMLAELIALEDAVLYHDTSAYSYTAHAPQANEAQQLVALSNRLRNNLVSLQQLRPGYKRIVIADKNGRIRLATEAGLQGHWLNQDSAFRGVLAASDRAYVRNLHLQPEPNGARYEMDFGYLIDQNTGADHPELAGRLGVVLITVDINEALFPLLREWRMGQTGELLLGPTETGLTLALNQTEVQPIHLSTVAPALAQLGSLRAGEFETVLTNMAGKQTAVLAAYRDQLDHTASGIHWQLVMKKDVSEVYASLSTLLAHVAWIAVTILLLTTLVSHFIAKTLSQPLAQFVHATQAVAQGNLKIKIELARGDEIGQLAVAFQEMIAALAQRQRELEEANQIVRSIANVNVELVQQLQASNKNLEAKIVKRTHDLAAANERLQKLDQMKSAFLLNVSHELRNPVTNLKFNLELLQKELLRLNVLSGKSERYVAMLTKQLDFLARVTEDMLHLLYLERGIDSAEFDIIDLNTILTTTLVDYQPRLDAAGLTLLYQPTAVPLLVKAEPTRLVQMLSYLLDNAIAYNIAAGQIWVRTLLNTSGQVGLQVEDTGMGIASEDIDHIFERFYRGTVINESAIAGTGLGLSIVKEIVKLHQGQIEVESKLGQGSRFSVWLPVEKAEKQTEGLYPEMSLTHNPPILSRVAEF